jgi:hypothetical protein
VAPIENRRDLPVVSGLGGGGVSTQLQWDLLAVDSLRGRAHDSDGTFRWLSYSSMLQQMPPVVKAIHFPHSLAMQNALPRCNVCWRLKLMCTVLNVSSFCICILVLESV